jgi:hypothetical protein
MTLVTKIKQQMFIHSCVKYQKLYSTKLKLLSQLLICLLAINATADTAQKTYSGTSPKALAEYYKGLQKKSATATYFLGVASHCRPISVVKGIGTISPVDLRNGTIALDPAKMELSGARSSLLTAYKPQNVLAYRQIVKGSYVYEYISNYQDNEVIGEDSSIYFGLTSAKDGSNYDLVAFNYEALSGEYSALTIDTNKLSERLSKDTLKSIVICTELSATNPAQDALYITGYNSTITLTDGLIIAKSANLIGATVTEDDKAGLAFEDREDNSTEGMKFKADIINYGLISGYCGVRINDTNSDSDFCLLPTDNGKTARFYNHGQVIGTNKAFKIMGQKSKEEVDTFELINHDTIDGGLQLVKPNKAINSINFNVVNYGTITTDATKDSIQITKYTGKPFSKLAFRFNSISPILTSMMHCSDSLHLEKNTRIVLAVDSTPAILPTFNNHFIIAEASNSFKLDADINDILFTTIKDIKYFIEVVSCNMSKNTITANLEAKPISTHSVTDARVNYYMPTMVKAVNASNNIDQALKTAGDIVKIISNKTEIAGINLSSFVSELNKNKHILFSIAKEYCSSADEFFDILMPDSSNSQLISTHVIANKFASQVSARLNSKTMATIKARGYYRATENQGVTSGDIVENISVWTSFDYFQNRTKSNDKKQNYNHFKAKTFSLGFDGESAHKFVTLGLSYGFCRGNNTVFGGSSGKQLSKTVSVIPDEEDLKAHTIILYSAMSMNLVAMQSSFYFGITKHTPKAVVNFKNYNSRIIGVNLATIYMLNLKSFNIDFAGRLGINIINTEQHVAKHEQKKDSKALVSLGLMTTINDIVAISYNVYLDYRFGIGGKYTIINDKSSSIIIADKSFIKPTTINYKKRQISPFNFNIDANINIEIYKSIRFGLDFNFGAGKDSIEFGGAASVRYMF